ncbi:MAG: methyltransferase domain-containing protein [Geminicoccaceae bacterium]|nr:methyltransferase domain-containing protein [Geminicoccaceae bacterium]
MSTPPLLFDRRLRRLRASSARGQSSLRREVLDDIGDRLLGRLEGVKRRFERILVAGSSASSLFDGLRRLYPDAALFHMQEGNTLWDGQGSIAKLCAGVTHVPFAASAFDLVLCVMEHHAVDDLPGSLAQLTRILQPDGLLLSVFPGGETLWQLRYAMLQAEIAQGGGAAPRVMPFVDVRDAGALLQRAGLALPVADIDRIELTYAHPLALVAELRALSETSCLMETVHRPVVRSVLEHFMRIYSTELCDDRGRAKVTIELVFMTGWVPHESQPAPLRPGSAKLHFLDGLGKTTS